MQKSILKFLFIVGFCYSVPSVLDSVMSVDRQQGGISSANTAIIQEVSVLSPEEMVSIKAGYGCGDKCTVNNTGCENMINCVQFSNIPICNDGILTVGYIRDDGDPWKDCEPGASTDYCPDKRPQCACRQAFATIDQYGVCQDYKGMVDTGCSSACGSRFTRGCQGGGIYDPCSGG